MNTYPQQPVQGQYGNQAYGQGYGYGPSGPQQGAYYDATQTEGPGIEALSVMVDNAGKGTYNPPAYPPPASKPPV